MHHSYLNVTMVVFRILLSFASTYLCGVDFQYFLKWKPKQETRIVNVENDLMLVLMETQPRIVMLINEWQFQSLH